MKKFLLSTLILFIGFANVYASHNRAGEITYKYIGDAAHPYKYHITVTTYTKWIDATSVDKCTLTVHFGDGTSADVPRSNGTTFSLCGSGIPDGTLLSSPSDTKYNTYDVDHNYTGAGNDTIWVDDQNRNAGVCNIADVSSGASISDYYSFRLFSVLVISPFLGHNDSPVLTNLPLDNACVGYCFEHNPGAHDIDDDSLYYTLSTCYGSLSSGVTSPPSESCLPIPEWSFPPNMNAESIDHNTGEFNWCSPSMVCQYNVAILIKEYRLIHGTHTRYYIGSVLRDMQINVLACANTPPQINTVNDTCVIAGNSLNFNVNASDAADSIHLTATGGPFVVSPPATFSTTTGLMTASGTFHWSPSCNEVRLLPYLVTIKALDTGSPPLASFESMFIKVIAPAPTGLTATPSGASIILNWNHPLCDSTGPNPLKKYYI
ncbi:MAG: hypothetical protein ACXVPM_04690, partial [Bacteroidia bacterium]